MISTSAVGRPLRFVAAAVFVFGLSNAAFAAPPADTMEQRMHACTACHGDQGGVGTGGYYPRIAGKPREYLYNQLLNIRDGRRHYPLMAGLLQNLSDDYLMEIAQYFSALDVPYPPPQKSTLPAAGAARAEALVSKGDAQRELPACVACHGDALTGVAPAVPGLLGLPTDYIRAQLGAWKSGSRKAAAPDCMATIARTLTPEEISLVSAWLSSRTVPHGPIPTAHRAKPPMDCGSVLDAAKGVQR